MRKKDKKHDNKKKQKGKKKNKQKMKKKTKNKKNINEKTCSISNNIMIKIVSDLGLFNEIESNNKTDLS